MCRLWDTSPTTSRLYKSLLDLELGQEGGREDEKWGPLRFHFVDGWRCMHFAFVVIASNHHRGLKEIPLRPRKKDTAL